MRLITSNITSNFIAGPDLGYTTLNFLFRGLCAGGEINENFLKFLRLFSNLRSYGIDRHGDKLLLDSPSTFNDQITEISRLITEIINKSRDTNNKDFKLSFIGNSFGFYFAVKVAEELAKVGINVDKILGIAPIVDPEKALSKVVTTRDGKKIIHTPDGTFPISDSFDISAFLLN